MKLFLIKWLATPVASIIIAYITAKLTTKRELKVRLAEWNRADDQQIRKDIADLRTNLEKMKLHPDAPSFRNNALESSMRLQSCGIAPVAEIAKQVDALVGNNNVQAAINAASALTSYPAAASRHRTSGFLSRLRSPRR